MSYTVLDPVSKALILEKLDELSGCVKTTSGARPGAAAQAHSIIASLKHLIARQQEHTTFASMRVLDEESTVFQQTDPVAVGEYKLIAVESVPAARLH